MGAVVVPVMHRLDEHDAEVDLHALLTVLGLDELATAQPSSLVDQLIPAAFRERTQTMVAFQQFSAHDLEAMFGLGLEDKQA